MWDKKNKEPIPPETNLAVIAAVDKLPENEQAALRYWKQARQAEVSRETSDEMYELYINGKNVDEIRRLNKGFSLGQIVHCKVRDSWDLRKEEHRQALQTEVAPRVMDAQLEAADFLGDMLAASVRLYSEPIKRFLQDGNKAHLKGTPLENGLSLKQLRDTIDTLRTVTGQDKKSIVEHRGTVGVVQQVQKVSSEEAEAALDELLLLEPVKK